MPLHLNSFSFSLFFDPDKPSMHTPEALVRSHVVYNAKVQFEMYFLFVPVVFSASTIFTTQWGDIHTRSGTLWADLYSKCTLCAPCL